MDGTCGIVHDSTIVQQQNRSYSKEGPRINILQAARLRLIRWSHEDLRAPYWRLYHNGATGATVRTANTTMQLEPEFCYLIPPETSFASELKCPLVHFFIHFILEPAWSVSAGNSRLGILRIPITSLISEILTEFLQAKAKTSWAENLMLYGLVSLVLSEVEMEPPSLLPPRIVEVCRHMEQNLARPLSNPDLARIAGMSTNAFIRLFRQTVGCPPKEWLAAARIREACFQLHHTPQTIDQIAEACGFCDRYHFSRVFRAHRQTSPAAFRKTLYRLIPAEV